MKYFLATIGILLAVPSVAQTPTLEQALAGELNACSAMVQAKGNSVIYLRAELDETLKKVAAQAKEIEELKKPPATPAAKQKP